jgi:hypothetical protein
MFRAATVIGVRAGGRRYRSGHRHSRDPLSAVGRSAAGRAPPRVRLRSSPGSTRAPDRAGRLRSGQTSHRENKPQSRLPTARVDDFVILLVMAWSPPDVRTPGSFAFQHPETTPPGIPTTPRTAPRFGSLLLWSKSDACRQVCFIAIRISKRC